MDPLAPSAPGLASATASALRPVWLCADDYGIAPGVSAGIRELIRARRLNATSVMTVSPHLDRAAAIDLSAVAKASRAAVGLHVTLTAPFTPLSHAFAARHGGTFLPLGVTLLRAIGRRFDAQAVTAECEAQFAAFVQLFRRPPDFVDGHQHVQVFPQIRDVFLAVTKRRAPQAWVRQCGRAAGAGRRADLKAMLLDHFSRSFVRKAKRLGIASNPAFAGTYVFRADADFPSLFPRFLDGLPPSGVVMCHPGHVDAALESLDPVTHLRQREYDYLAGDDFPDALARARMTLDADYHVSAMRQQ